MGEDEAEYIPGLGCGCKRCRDPGPVPGVMTLEEAGRRQADYEQRRLDFQAAHGRVMFKLGRGGKSG